MLIDLSLAEGILFFVRSVGLGPDGTRGRRIISVPTALLFAGEVELNVLRVEGVVVLVVVVLGAAAVVLDLTVVGLGVGAFRANETVDVGVIGFVEALDVAVDDIGALEAVVEVTVRVGLGAVVLGDDGVLLRDAPAGDAVRVSVLLADTVDVVVFFISSTLGFVAGVLVVAVLVVEAGVLAPTALVEAPAGVFGLVIGAGLDDIGVTLEGVAGVGLVVVVGRVVGFAGAADFVTPLVLLAAVAPDAGLLIGDVEPDTGGLVVVLDVVLAIGLGAGAFVLGFKGVADAPAGLDVTPVVLTGAGFVPRLSAGDAVRFSSTTFFSSGFFVSLISSTGGSVTIVTGIISSVSFLSSLWSVTSIASSITSGTGVAGVKLTIGAAKTSVSLSLSDCKLV